MSASPAPRPLALTMGEPAGIGGEIALKAWRRRSEAPAPFFVIDDAGRLEKLAARIGVSTPVAEIAGPEEATAVFADALPVLAHRLAAPVTPGRPDPANAPAVIAAVERAVALAQSGRVGAVVTNPIHKKSLYDAGFRHPGHTEFLGELAGGGARPVMMLVCPGLRVVPVTVHLPLSRAVATLTSDAITYCGEITAAALRQEFGVARPRLAVAGVNPHAGEDGSLGREEIDIIAPAVEALRRKDIDAHGPAPADSLFHERARARWDAVICMYHDQALIALKTIDFDHGVNVTLGLPFVRTSPDHGSALAIAGSGEAREDSLLAALATAAEIARRRAGDG